MNYSSSPHSESQPQTELDPVPEFDIPVGQFVTSVENLDGVNVIFDPPIPCVMRDPDGQDRPVRLVDSDDLIARIFAGWCIVEVA